MYYIFTFRSRAGAMKFIENLKREGQYAEIVSTPQSISRGCGLSVKVRDPSVGRRLLSMSKYTSFTGLYQVKDFNGKLNIVKK